MLGRSVCGRRWHVWQGREALIAGEGGVRGRRDGHCSGRYASHWNVFLFCIFFSFAHTQSTFQLKDYTRYIKFLQQSWRFFFPFSLQLIKKTLCRVLLQLEKSWIRHWFETNFDLKTFLIGSPRSVPWSGTRMEPGSCIGSSCCYGNRRYGNQVTLPYVQSPLVCRSVDHSALHKNKN